MNERHDLELQGTSLVLNIAARATSQAQMLGNTMLTNTFAIALAILVV